MRKFLVYFEQVNQEAVEVSAYSEDVAVERARRIWRGRNHHPLVTTIKELEKTGGKKDG